MANLPFGVTEEMLLEVFREVGAVKSIRYFILDPRLL